MASLNNVAAKSTPVTELGTSREPRRGYLIVLSLLAGLAIAVLWSAQLVDDDIGVNTANGLLGDSTMASLSTGTVTGMIAAFVTGLAGTFTACNVAVFSAIAPLVEAKQSLAGRLSQGLRPLGWLTLGALVVAAAYGAVGAVLGSRLPQLSAATVGDNVPVRVLQSVVVFGLIGLVMLYMGLMQIGVLPDFLARFQARWPQAPQVFMGLLVGAFLIGRPWPVFHTLFQHAAHTDNPLLGAVTFALVVIGNMLVLGAVFLGLSLTTFPKWLQRKSTRVATVSAAAMLVGGSFTFAYWVLRVPAGLGYGWFPAMPWH